MRIKYGTVVSQGAASNAAFSAAAAPAANVPVTLLAAAASISPAREISLTASADISGVTFTIVGLDRRGLAQTETIKGPASATTVTGRKIWSSITSITPNATDTDTAAFGYPARVVSNWYLNNTTHSREGIPIAKVQVLPAIIGETFGAGIVELTEENVARVGEGAAVETTTLSLSAAGVTVAPQSAWFRVVITDTNANRVLRYCIARPSF